MQRKFMKTFIVVLALAALAASSCAFAADKNVTLKMGNVTSDSAKKAGAKFKELLAKYSGGSVKVELFDDNVLGDDKTVVEMTQVGDCDIAVSSTSSLTPLYPDYYIFDMPYMFLSKNEVYKVGFNGKACKKIVDGVESLGLKGLGMWENGFRNLTTKKTPAMEPKDVKGLKIRTMENDVHLAAWKAMGANPTPMAFTELYTAMQQGTVDGEENPIGIIMGNRFYEVQKNVIYTEHVYTPYCVIMNADKWKSLSNAQQAALTKAMKEATDYQYKTSQSIEDSSDKMLEKAGVKVTHLTPAQKQAFQKAVESANCLAMIKKKMKHPEYAQQMLEELQAARKK